MKTLKLTLCLLIISSIFGTGFYFGRNSVKPIDNQNVIISGDTDKIQHSNFKFTSKDISFDTTSTGEGNINTKISTENIPEVYKWKNYNQIFKVNYGYHSFGCEYIFRYDRYLIGVGVNNSPDVYLSAGIMF